MPVTNLRDHQVDQLVADVTRLDQVGGSDAAALLRIRAIVSRELLDCDDMDLTTAALGRLERESAVKRLLSIVNYCSEHFVGGSQVLSVVALPVSIRLQSLNQQQMSIRTGERGALKDLAQKMVDAVGARHVVFDTRMYQGPELFQMKSRDMRAFLMQLVDGTLYPLGGPPEFSVYSEVNGPWRLVYFLGVEVMDKPKYPSLEDWPVQMKSRGWLDHASAAIECADEVMFNANVQAQAESHGVFYLSSALRAGMKGHRAIRIAEMLRALEIDGGDLIIYLTDSGLGCQVRTLMVSPLLAFEQKWDLMHEESIWDFQCELERLALDLMQEFEPQCLQHVERDEYQRLAMKHHVHLFR